MPKDTNLTIELQGLRFYGQYGLYPVESKWTTALKVDVRIQTNIPVNEELRLEDTIDYSALYTLIALHMNQRHELLESIANQLIKKIKNWDKRILSCKIRIHKIPIVSGALDGVTVQLEY